MAGSRPNKLRGHLPSGQSCRCSGSPGLAQEPGAPLGNDHGRGWLRGREGLRAAGGARRETASRFDRARACRRLRQSSRLQRGAEKGADGRRARLFGTQLEVGQSSSTIRRPTSSLLRRNSARRPASESPSWTGCTEGSRMTRRCRRWRNWSVLCRTRSRWVSRSITPPRKKCEERCGGQRIAAPSGECCTVAC